ncbi:2-oxobutyrate oxidase [Aliidiomarina minuta]|uniref:2-oxoglutarate-dependent ethylene/succinate-forming enzyme n=1 Tax=Aliidiomarina minuta TaxID=880057 RepID=A0A432W152_9GAMM|nr:2-oxoglutarate and iron-dependent oxygenase domain-containing protein [Aliidiomarina minuta]RUO22952.1 2-oxobutyrate oxidase [Aliidiomarina minuta]
MIKNNAALPVLDLSQLLAGGEAKQKFLKELAEAARTIGFFYLTGHGLATRQQDILQLSQQFFALPEHEKLSIQMRNSAHFRGYTKLQGELTQGKPDLREQFDIMREEPAVDLACDDSAWWKLIGPNQWPAAMPSMRSALLEWQENLSEVSVTLLRAFADVLQQPEDIFDATIADAPYTHMKLIRYPGSGDAVRRQGVGAHKDPGYLTIVAQDDQSGLEVLTDDKGWVSAAPIEGAFVVNIGELLELASNGYLRATYHRVVSPQTATERFSCAFFMAAQLNTNVPLLELPEALREEALGPASDPENPLFYQVGDNVLKGRLRSHPDVAAAHYPKFAKAG